MNAIGHAKFILRSERMVLPLWRSLHSLNLMLPKEDRRAMLLRLYNEDTPLMDHSKDRFHNNNYNSSKPEPSAHVKDGEDNIKEEEDEDGEAGAEVKEEMAVKEEDEGGDVAAAGSSEDAEAMENGAGDGDGERDHGMLPDSSKDDGEDGV